MSMSVKYFVLVISVSSEYYIKTVFYYNEGNLQIQNYVLLVNPNKYVHTNEGN